MAPKRKFACAQCGKSAECGKAPVCCGRKMEPLKACTRATSDAEHARMDGDDEPCDDGR